MTGHTKPFGKDEVRSALVEATINLLVDHGTDISVRQIAAVAGVNHGLVHTYFGSKHALLTAALDEINRRTSAELDASGFPPADLAMRRGGELAKVVARIRFDSVGDLFSSHPVTSSWIDALAASRSDLDSDTVDEMVVTAATLALGWAVFADHLCEAVQIDAPRRQRLDERVAALVAELGGLPDAG
jgi:AcrR family transcriptional regulator